MKPLLAHVYEPHRVIYPCYVQPKLNGIRALYQGGRFQSRDELPFPVGLLDHLSTPLQTAFGPKVILDGELYVHGWPLQRINAAVTPVRQTPTEDTLKVEYHVFDVVDFGKSFEERMEWLWQQGGFTVDTPLRQPLTTTAHTEAIANEFYADFVANGYEGMMYRLGDCPYTKPKQANTEQRVVAHLRNKFLSDKDNRCWHLLKRKDWQDDEFVCEGVAEGEGKYAGTLGALKCVCSSGWGHFTVSGGLTDALRDKYWDHPELIIGKQIKVRYLCLSSDGIPLNPTIEAIL